jgi:hypothetical protein
MQIRTHADQMEVSQPTAAPAPEQQAAQEKARKTFETTFAEGKGQDFSALAKEATQKREEMGFKPAPASPPSRAPSESPSSEDIVLKPGKTGEETLTHSVDKYRDEAANYVEQAGIDQATIGQTAEMLITDYVDVKEGEQRYNEMARKKQIAEQALQAADTLTSKERKRFKAQVKWADEHMNALLKALHETDFGKATQDARSRAEEAQAAAGIATQEKATIEYLYDEVEKKKAEVKQRKSSANRKQKKDPAFNAQTAQMEKSAADTARDLTQQAKMSFDVIQVRRRSTDNMKEHVQKNLDRFAGKARKLGGKAAAGSLNAIVGIATLGLVGAKENTTIKGYMGKGLEKKGWPVKATFLNDIRNQLAQFRNVVKARPSGPSALDVTSALLRGFNEIVVQNVINISGKLALITGLLATLLGAAASVTFGGTAPAAGVLATISSVATFVALIAAALKATVSMARITIDGLAALFNQDAKMRNVLKSRAKQAGLETITDATQAATLATGLPTSEAIKGNDFFNMFDPSEIIKVKTGMVTNQATSSSLSDTVKSIAGPATSATMTVGGPLLTGPVMQGVVAAVDEPYGLHTQHPDEMGMAPPNRAGGGLRPPSKQRARLEAQSKPNKQGNAPEDAMTPTWMQTELEKQNQLRAKAYQERTAVGVGQIAAVKEKSTKIANKLRVGKNKSEELDTQLEASKNKGNDQVDSESLEMSRQQSRVLDTSAGTITETVAALTHSQREIKQLAEQQT